MTQSRDLLRERRVMDTVKRWCEEHELKLPERIVIEKKSADGWWLWIGPEPKAHHVKVDPENQKVLEWNQGE